MLLNDSGRNRNWGWDVPQNWINPIKWLEHPSLPYGKLHLPFGVTEISFSLFWKVVLLQGSKANPDKYNSQAGAEGIFRLTQGL